MTQKLAEWVFEIGQISEIWLPDRRGGNTVSMVVGFS